MSCQGGTVKMMGGGRRSRKMRGGNFYGAAVDPGLGSAGLAYPAVENVGVDKSGNPVPDAVMPKTGGRRRRTGKKATRKGGRKSRRVHRRRRTMRGGATMYNVAPARAEWAGEGTAGLASYRTGAANAPAGGTQVAGVWQV